MEPLALRKLMVGILYNLKVRDRQKALRVLKAEAVVSHPMIFGADVHFLVMDEAHLPHIKSILENANVEVIQMEPVQPSLEDVYLSMLREDG
jgi:hypothetical protein